MLTIDLRGKKALVAGISDDKGFGWAIARTLAEAGATLLVATWAPVFKLFCAQLAQGKWDLSRRLQDGRLMEFAAIYPIDAQYDKMEDVPEEVREHKRYKEFDAFGVADVASLVSEQWGGIDILIHSLANGPEVQRPLLETSRQGYLTAISSSAYSFVSMISHFGPLMCPRSSALTISYLASQRVIPGYGGGMSSAKAALESDTRTLAWEAGRRWGVRVNCVSAGPMASRAAKAIGFIDDMIAYSEANAPLPRQLESDEVGAAAAFLCSPLAAAITGTILYVDHGLHVMGVAPQK